MKIFHQNLRYLDIGQLDRDFIGSLLMLETVLEKQFALNILGPQASDDIIIEEPLDHLPIVIRKDVSEDLHAILAKSLLKSDPCRLVLLLLIHDAFRGVHQKDQGTSLIVRWILETELLLNEDTSLNE